MKACFVGLLALFVFASMACAADKELSTEEKEKQRHSIAMLRDQLAGWLADDPKDMPVTLTEPQRNGILNSRKFVLKAIPEKLTVASSKRHKVLVISIVHPAGHHVDAQGAMLAILHQVSQKTDALELTLATDTDLVKLSAENMKDFDAVIINSNFPLKDNPDLGDEGRAKLQTFCDELLPNYVKGGGGLFVYHWGITNVSKPYVQMVGGSFGGHPPGDGQVYPVKVMDPQNPLMAAFLEDVDPKVADQFKFQAPKEFSDELYNYSLRPDKDPAVRILLALDTDKLPPKIQLSVIQVTANPLIWIKRFGAGRIYYSQFGHSARILSVPTICRSMLDGLQYVLGDLKVDDLPLAQSSGGKTPDIAPTAKTP